MEDKIFYGRQDEQATMEGQPEFDNPMVQKLITEEDIATLASYYGISK